MEFFEHVWSIIKTIQFRDIIDILAIALIIFGLFRLLRDTRAIQLLKGIAFLFIVYFLSSLLELVMLSTLLRAFFEAAVVVIVVIFQPEIRKALEQMGRNKTWTKRFVFLFKSLGKSDEWKDAVRKSITDAADTSVLFSRSKTGALIVFERETMLSDIAATERSSTPIRRWRCSAISFSTRRRFMTARASSATASCMPPDVFFL